MFLTNRGLTFHNLQRYVFTHVGVIHISRDGFNLI